jgi:signal transduction histidine kinase/FixJ family two-component response regulator
MSLFTEHRRRILLATITVACGLVSCAYLAHRYQLVHGPVYRIGYTNQPELFRPEANGQPSGFAVRLMQEASRRSGVKLEWVYAPEGADEALLNGRVDLWPYLHNKQYLEKRVHFTRPYLESEYSVLHLETTEPAGGRGRRVAIPKGLFHWYLGGRLFPGAELVAFDGDREMLAALCGGDAEYALIRRGRAVLLAEEWASICTAALPHLDPVSSPELLISIAANASGAAAAEALRDGLDESFAAQSLEQIVGSYYLDVAVSETVHGSAGAARAVNRWLWLGVAGLGALLLVTIRVSRQVAAANQKLRHSVAERDRLVSEVRNAEAAKTQFVANMSHELCTPMNGILGTLELLRESPMEGGQRELLRTATRSSRSLYSLLKRLLEFSQIESNQMEFEQRPFSVLEVVESLATTACTAAEEKGIGFVLRIDPAAPGWLTGDPRRLRGVLECLIQNAVKFTSAGRVHVRVLPPAGEGDCVRIEVADTGVGIAPDRQARIFEAFEQADTSMTRQYGGLGIGLTMALRMARRMDGRIVLDSKPGEGSLFTVHLPASMLCAVPAGQAPYRANRGGRAPQRAVVIHADAEVRGVLQETISATGMRVLALEKMPVGGLVGDSIAHIFVEESQLETHVPSWPSSARVVLLYARAAATRALIPGRGFHELASPFLPSEVRHLLRGGTFAFGAPVSAPGPRSAKAGGFGLQILLVDDSRTNLKIAEQILVRMGCKVYTAENGQQGLDSLAEAHGRGEVFDLVLMDCQMPVLDGYEATRRLRGSDAPYRAIPVIALTAQIGPGERAHCLAAGMNDYLTKPISRQAVWRLLQRHATRGGVASLDSRSKMKQGVDPLGHLIGANPA